MRLNAKFPFSPSGDSCLTPSMWDSCEMRQGSQSENANDGTGWRSGRIGVWNGWRRVRGSLFEQVNLGMIGSPPVCEKEGEYIDLCLIKKKKKWRARHVIP